MLVAHVGVGMFAIEHVVQHAMAQGALGGLHAVDPQQVEHGPQHADAAADHGPAVVLQPRQPHAVGAARLQQLALQPVQRLRA